MARYIKLKYCTIWCLKTNTHGKEIIIIITVFRTKSDIQTMNEPIHSYNCHLFCLMKTTMKKLQKNAWGKVSLLRVGILLVNCVFIVIKLYWIFYRYTHVIYGTFQNHAEKGSYKGVGCPWLTATNHIKKFSLGEV